MNKMSMGLTLAASWALLVAVGCEKRTEQVSPVSPAAQAQQARVAGASGKPIPKPTPEQLAEYRKRLGDNAYHILFEAGTEPPFRNAYHDNHQPGTYVSAVTGEPLFSSDDKFDSGTGWPSFTKPVSPDAVILREDGDGSGRFEVLDASSGGHLGHVFDDGPADKGGKRYCMNSAAMKFVPKP